MLELKIHHDDYDPAMEILALLPCHPLGVPLRLLALDLGLTDRVHVREFLGKLKREGIKTATWNNGKESVAAVLEQSWNGAQALGLDYLNRIGP